MLPKVKSPAADRRIQANSQLPVAKSKHGGRLSGLPQQPLLNDAVLLLRVGQRSALTSARREAQASREPR